MKVLGVVVNYRVPELAVRAVASLVADFGGLDGRVIVVENDSQDGSLETIRRAVVERGLSERVEVIASDRNGGFGAGNNVAFRRVLGSADAPDYFFLLNPDASVHPGTTLALATFLQENPEAGVVGARVLDEQGRPTSSAFRFPSVLGELESSIRIGLATRVLARHVVPIEPSETTTAVDWVSGSCLMIRREALERVGLFDEEFFLYYEEIDLCRRMRAAGFSVHYLARTAVDHQEAAATGVKGDKRRPRYWHDSRRRYYEKHHGRAYFLVATLTHVLGASVHRARCALTGREPEYPPNLLLDMLEHAVRSKPSSANPA